MGMTLLKVVVTNWNGMKVKMVQSIVRVVAIRFWLTFLWWLALFSLLNNDSPTMTLRSSNRLFRSFGQLKVFVVCFSFFGTDAITFVFCILLIALWRSSVCIVFKERLLFQKNRLINVSTKRLRTYLLRQLQLDHLQCFLEDFAVAPFVCSESLHFHCFVISVNKNDVIIDYW